MSSGDQGRADPDPVAGALTNKPQVSGLGSLLRRKAGPALLSLARRTIGAALLDGKVYEHFSRERGTGLQAIAVLVAVVAARGVGKLGVEGGGWVTFLLGVFLALVWWTVFTLVGYIVAAMIQPSESRPRQAQMARLIAFAQAPGVLWVLGLIPRFGFPIVNAVVVWQLVATAFAFQHALGDRSSQGVLKSIGITVAGLVVWVMIQVVFRL